MLGGVEEVVGAPPGRPRPVRVRTRTVAVEPARPTTAADRLRGLAVAAVPATAAVLFGAVEPEHTLPIQAAALLLGAGALCARAGRGERPLPLPSVTLPVLLLCALPAVQLIPIPAGAGAWIAPGLRRLEITHLTTISVNPEVTLLALLRWMSYAAFFIAALEMLRRPGALRSALSVVAVLGVAEAAYGIGNLMTGNARLLWIERTAYHGDATGTLVNRNHFATMMLLCLAAVLARRWLARPRSTDAERALTVLSVVAAALIGVAILLSHSRGGILSLGVTMLVMAVLVPRDREGRRGRAALGGLAALVLFYGTWIGLETVAQRFHLLGREAATGRTTLWRDTLAMVGEFPVLGAGAGTFEAVYPAYRNASRWHGGYAHAHQDWLELAAEGGVLAVALAITAGIAYVRIFTAAPVQAIGQRRLATVALLSGIVGAMLHAAVDFPLRIPGVVWLTLLLAAAAPSRSTMPDGRAHRARGHEEAIPTLTVPFNTPQDE
jgi:O-antigen ligase